MLGKPVVITRYATSSSQLQDGVDGVIVPMENKGCANALAELLNEKETLRRVAENTKNYDYSKRDPKALSVDGVRKPCPKSV